VVHTVKIIHIVPGSGGGFYCENCMRDGALVTALREQGHDVVLAPMYLPLFGDHPGLSRNVPVFFGGINVYLQQKSRLFRHTPRWLDRLLDADWLLQLAALRARTTRAAGLGEMTLSMLYGEGGHQAKELERLLAWLRVERPDLVHLSNALLIGLAPRLKSALGVPVACSLQDEDTWLDGLGPPHDRWCWDAIAERVPFIDAFFAVSEYYACFISERLPVPAECLYTVYPGSDRVGEARSPLPAEPPVIGYLSRLTPALGLDTLVNAFIELKRDPRLAATRLRLTGGSTADDAAWLRQLRAVLRGAGVAGDVEFIESFDRESRSRFLQGLTVLSVPVPKGEAFGAYLIEAMAFGVPVVQPRTGAFEEVIGKTGGGVCYAPNDAATLAKTLGGLLTDRGQLQRLADAGYQAVQGAFNMAATARQTARIYELVCGRARG